MRIRVLLFFVGLIVKELLTGWFLFTRGAFHLTHTANIVVAVASALLMAALTVVLIRVSSAVHTDPDPAWVGWIRFIAWTAVTLFSVALVLLQPLAGAPALALTFVAGWVTVNERRRERVVAAAQRLVMPTVPNRRSMIKNGA